MPSRLFNVVVVLFWASTMTWLAITKVLPPLRIGEPPNYQAILQRDSSFAPVCWTVRCNDELLGWAATRISRRHDDMKAIQGRVFLDQLPLEELSLGWLGSVIKPYLRHSGSLALTARNQADIDPLGRLVSFETRVQVAKVHDAIKIQGQVDGTQLRITVQSGDVVFKEERYLPTGAFVGDELLPQAVLPGLHVGQTWTMPVYSPFRPHKNPLEVLQAEVERHQTIRWNGAPVNALVVVYRADSGAGLASHGESRGMLWVDENGMVLKQQFNLFNSPLVFERLPPEKSERVIGELGADWDVELTPQQARRLLQELIE